MNQPPRILLWLLDRLCPESRPDLKGDLLEAYELRRRNVSITTSNLRLLLETLSIIPLRFIIREQTTFTSPFMILTNLKIARRSLLKDRLNTMINILGLSLSLSACLLITLFVRDELSYDQHFQNKERIMRIGGNYKNGSKGNDNRSPVTSWMLMPLLEGRVSGVEMMTRVNLNRFTIEVDGKEYHDQSLIYADSTFFDIFSFPLLSGDRSTVLDDPTGVVIDRSTSRKLFDDEEPIGKVISIFEKPFHVTGVMDDIPANTHFGGSIIFPMSGMVDTFQGWVRSNVTGRSVYTYIKTDGNFNEQRFAKEVDKAITDPWPDNRPEFYAQPITAIHLGPKYPGESDLKGSKVDVYIFSLTALVILILACINYINLSIASALPRSKSAGIKKVLGSTNGMLIGQFQTESYLVLIISVAISALLAWGLMPFFNQLSAKDLSFTSLANPFMLGLTTGVVVIIGLLAGSLPALSILRNGTIGLLTDKIHFRGRRSWFSNSLIVFQFVIATTLIACTLIVTKQIRYIRNRDIGMNPHQLVTIPLQLREIMARYDVLRNEMAQVPGVTSISGSIDKITNDVTSWRPYDIPGTDDAITIPTINVEHDFFETIGAKILYGRSFSRDYPADFKSAFILNESAAKLMGKTNPVGMNLDGGAFNGEEWYSMHARVIGVVKDFHFASLHSEVGPIVFSLISEATPPVQWLEVRIEDSDVLGTIGRLEEVWKRLAPERSFTYEFVDDAIAAHYTAERQFLKIFVVFSALAIMLGALGLFGLTDLMTKRRTKEIGIRKIVGASTPRIVGLVSRDFLLLVVAASLVGCPLAWYFMHQWLNNFTVKTSVPVWIFLTTGLSAVAISFAAILVHALRVSRANPVNALRCE